MSDSAHALKNITLSPAASDLGLGDQLKTQLDDQLDEQRKLQNSGGQTFGAMGAASSALSPATMALLGKQGGGAGYV